MESSVLLSDALRAGMTLLEDARNALLPTAFTRQIKYDVSTMKITPSHFIKIETHQWENNYQFYLPRDGPKAVVVVIMALSAATRRVRRNIIVLKIVAIRMRD